MKDGTAQGVAKARHYEAMFDESHRLFLDPYAHLMYPGGWVQSLLGTTVTRWLYGLLGPGILEMLLIRTKWLDEQILSRATQMEQMIILGAGYDTRGFRLDLPQQSFQVWEVDQPEVQAKKRSRLDHIAKTNTTVAQRMDSSVKFVSVDFNSDAMDEKLKQADGFESSRPSIVLLEGVTQYIPKSSTAETLRKIKSLVAPGSILLVSYVDQKALDEPEQVGPIRSVNNLLNIASKVGEPWVSFWTQEDFRQYMDELGYEVLENTTCSDYNESYMVPLGRAMRSEEITSVERFVVARIRG